MDIIANGIGCKKYGKEWNKMRGFGANCEKYKWSILRSCIDPPDGIIWYLELVIMLPLMVMVGPFIIVGIIFNKTKSNSIKKERTYCSNCAYFTGSIKDDSSYSYMAGM